jgi:hypothetical protein
VEGLNDVWSFCRVTQGGPEFGDRDVNRMIAVPKSGIGPDPLPQFISADNFTRAF